MDEDISKIIAQIDEYIRTGQTLKAKKAIYEYKKKKVPREHIVVFANFARRLNLLNFAILLLRPIVRPKIPLAKEATPSEWTIYAAVLIKLGAYNEAIKILSEQVKNNCVDAQLYLSFAYFTQWDYAPTIPLLKEYIRSKEITEYQVYIGKVNLVAACLYANNYALAEKELTDILEKTTEKNWTLLHANALELSAQLSINKQDWKSAKKYLTEGHKQLKKSKSRYDFFLRKWFAISELLQNPSEDNKKLLLALRAEALKDDDYENVRDIDNYLASAFIENDLLVYVYYGTPFEAYRKKLLSLFKDNIKIPKYFTWKLLSNKNKESMQLELSSAKMNGKNFLKPGQGLHKLLNVLTSDFYKPFLLGELFSHLFPDEYYNTQSSPKRIHQLIKRLREKFIEYDIPLEITVINKKYKIKATGPIDILLEEDIHTKINKEGHSHEVQLKKLKSHFNHKSFSSSQGAAHLDISKRSVNFIIKWALEENKIYKIGSGRSILYTFENTFMSN